jgi:hypothetical protein
MSKMQPIIQLTCTHNKAASKWGTAYFTSPEDKAETVLGSCKNIFFIESDTKYTYTNTLIYTLVFLVSNHCKM